MTQIRSLLAEVWWTPLSWLLNVISVVLLFWDKFLPGDWPGRLPVASFFQGIHWHTRIAILLAVNLFVVLKGAYSAIRKRDSNICELKVENDNLQRNLKPPDLAVACSGFPSHDILTISNAGPGTAHSITVECMSNRGVYSESEHIDFIEEGKVRSYKPRVYLELSKGLGEMDFGVLLNAAYNERPATLAVAEPTVLSMRITHFDASNRKFEHEFEVRYVRVSGEVNISLKERKLVQ